MLIFPPATPSHSQYQVVALEGTWPILNHESPSQYLDPHTAKEYAGQTFIVFTVVGAIGWDFLVTLPDEIRVFGRRKFTLPIVAHYTSRICVFPYVILTAIYTSTPIGDCSAVRIMIGVFFLLTMGATSLLFYIRVRAIFEQSLVATIVFGFVWLSILVTALLAPFASRVEYIGPTKICRIIFEYPFGFPTWPILVMTGFDTLVFLAIAWKLIKGVGAYVPSRDGSSKWKCVKMFLTGDGLPLFSKFLLHGDRKYYMCTVGLDIVVLLVAVTGPSFAASAEVIMSLIFSDVVLKNVLACRLFRQTLLDPPGTGNQGSHLEIQRQTSIHLQRDLFLTDELLKNRSIRVNGRVAEDVLRPPSAVYTREI